MLFYSKFFFRLFPVQFWHSWDTKPWTWNWWDFSMPAVPVSGQEFLVLIKILKMRFLILKKYIPTKSHCLRGPINVLRLFLVPISSFGQNMILVTPRLWLQCPYRHSLELGPDDPCGSLSTQNILWICEHWAFPHLSQVSKSSFCLIVTYSVMWSRLTSFSYLCRQSFLIHMKSWSRRCLNSCSLIHWVIEREKNVLRS